MPRCLFSIEDAMFCARFIGRMAEARVPNFTFANSMDLLCKDAVPMIRCCTDLEAGNLIAFMKEVRSFLACHADCALVCHFRGARDCTSCDAHRCLVPEA
jgi:Transcription factor/nuclear export subunit protein 2